MKANNEFLSQTYSFLALRRAVGWIGILLPLVLVLGTFLITGERAVLKTISLYYHTGMRDVFVGSICAIALFLFFYKGYDRWDNWACNIAGFFALGIALFPTSRARTPGLGRSCTFSLRCCFLHDPFRNFNVFIYQNKT